MASKSCMCGTAPSHARARRLVVPSAIFGGGKQVTFVQTKAPPPSPSKKNPVLEKLNKEAAKQKSTDAELLYQAKYGKLENGRLTPEQSAALARRARGTARDFFKDFVQPDVKEAYLKPTETSQVPFLNFLVGVVVALVGTTLYVVVATTPQ